MKMYRTSVMENRLYLGSVSHSLEHIPRWYQIFALSGICFVIYLRDNPVVRWLVTNLHSSFGTEWIWYPEYQNMLEQMSFNERLCFALFGVTLALCAAFLYKLFCQGAFSIGWQSNQLFPDKRIPTIVTSILMCITGVLTIQDCITQCMEDPDSLSNLALHRFKEIENTRFDPRLAQINPHFVIQLELLKIIFLRFVKSAVPQLLLAGMYRMSRDVPRRSHVAIRWYMATFCSTSVVLHLVQIYISKAQVSVGTLVSVAAAVVYLAMTNYIYGPLKRAGIVVTVSTTDSVKEAIRGLTTCGALWGITGILVLTVVVSVHVVELISIWLIISLLIVWIPAIVDSCSTDYIVMLTGAASFIGRQMGLLTTYGAFRFGVMVSLWWLVLALVYNVVVNSTGTRYAGLSVVLWILFYFLSPSQVESSALNATPKVNVSFASQTASSSSSSGISPEELSDQSWATLEGGILYSVIQIDKHLSYLAKIADYSPELNATATTSSEKGNYYFTAIVQYGVAFALVLTTILSLMGRRQSSELKTRLRRRAIVLVSLTVLFQKLVHTIVTVLCVLSAIIAGVAFQINVMPHLAKYMPGFVSKGISGVVACTVLGSLMDMKDTMYDGILRFLGVLDPPNDSEDADERYETFADYDDFENTNNLTEDNQ